MTLLNTAAVFGVQWIVVTALGAGPQTDAFFLASVVPTLLANVVCGSLSFVLVPILAVSNKVAAATLVWTTGTAVGVLLAVVASMLWWTADYWIHFLAPGFTSEELSLAGTLVRIQLIGIAFTGTSTVLTAAYNGEFKFLLPAVATTAASVICLLGVAITIRQTGVLGAAWAASLRPLLLTILLLPIAWPARLPRWPSPEFRATIKKLLPLAAGSAYYKTDQLVDRLLASLAPAGTLSVLHLAQQLYSAANQMLVAGIAAPPVPRLAMLASQSSPQYLKDVTALLARLMAVGCIVYVAVIYPGKIVLEAVFAHGNMGGAQVRQIWILMIAFGLAWFAGLSGQVLSSAFYAAGDTSTPTRIGIVGFSVGVILKIAGFFAFGVVGVAVATGVYSAGNSIAMGLILRKRFGNKPEA